MSNERKNVAILLENNYERPFKLIDGLLSVSGVQERCAFRSFTLHEAGRDDLFTEDWAPDGIITCYDEKSEPWLKELDVPVVNLISIKDGVHPSVGTDYASMAKVVVEHFDALEFKHLLVLETEGVEEGFKLEPYLKPYCEEVGIEVHFADMPDGLDVRDVRRLAEICPQVVEKVRMFKGSHRVGIFARHDRRARLVVDYLTSEGIKIPQEMAVLGCFDSVEAKLSDPPLSSITLRDIETGARGMEKLEKLMQGKSLSIEHEKIPVAGVRVRASTVGADEGDLDILKARSIIRLRAREGITVDMLVQEMKISRTTFEKRFLALTGQSPAQEIRQVRLNWAQEILRTTDLPMSSLAPLVGFKDRRAFVVFFKREAGMTPSEFRMRHRA